MAELTQKPGGFYYILPADAGANGVTGYLVIRKVRWVGAATIADVCVLCDQAGNTFFESKAAGTWGIDDCRFPPFLQVNGMTVKTLSSGVVYVYCQ